MPLLAKEPGSQKRSTLCSEGVLRGLDPFPLGLLHHPSGIWVFPGICLLVLECPHGCCCILAGTSMSLGNISQCPASAFRAADLLFLAVPTEIQTSLFLFKYFSVVSPQPILPSWDQLGLDAIADLSSLEPGLVQAA